MLVRLAPRGALRLLPAAVLLAAPALGQVSFAPPASLSVTPTQALAGADVDLDGDVDVVVAGATQLAWLANDGTGAVAGSVPIGSETAAADLATGDMDGDGDVDVVAASSVLALHASVSRGAAWTRSVISTAGSFPALTLVDVDRDGDLDVAAPSVGTGSVSWFENQGTGFTRRVIAAVASPTAIATCDLDRDGAPDFATTGTAGVVTYRNVVGDGSAFATSVAGVAAGLTAVAAFDADRDGDLDLLAAGFGGTVQLEDVAGDGSAYALAPSGATAFATLTAGDVDRDGDVDALAAGASLAWLDQVSPASWHERTLGASAAVAVRLLDLDGDGDLDALEGGPAGLLLYANLLAKTPPTGFVDRAPVSTTTDFTIGVASGDVDGDGHADAISSSFLGDAVAWHENATGDARTWITHPVDGGADGANSVACADVDGDGDLDLFSTSRFDDRVAWYENVNGDGSAWIPRDVTASADGARSAVPADVDEDGDVDVVVAARLSGRITWHENTAGDGSTFTAHLVDNSAIGARVALAGDLDLDGDQDLVAVSADDNTVAWHENDGSLGFTKRLISTTAEAVSAVALADVDGDGDPDPITASFLSDELAWHRHDGGGAWSTQVVETSGVAPFVGAISVAAADADLDGDVDLFTAWLTSDTVSLHENLTGDGTSWRPELLTTAALGAHFVVADDFDGDGRPDALSASREDDTVACFPARAFGSLASALSLAAGGVQELSLNAGVAHAGSIAWILGSVTGDAPGFALDGVHVPLNPDAWFQFTLTRPFAGIFTNFFSLLDAAGTGVATFTLPAGIDPGLAGLTFHHAFLASEVLGEMDFASSAVRLELLP